MTSSTCTLARTLTRENSSIARYIYLRSTGFWSWLTKKQKWLFRRTEGFKVVINTNQYQQLKKSYNESMDIKWYKYRQKSETTMYIISNFNYSANIDYLYGNNQICSFLHQELTRNFLPRTHRTINTGPRPCYKITSLDYTTTCLFSPIGR